MVSFSITAASEGDRQTATVEPCAAACMATYVLYVYVNPPMCLKWRRAIGI